MASNEEILRIRTQLKNVDNRLPLVEYPLKGYKNLISQYKKGNGKSKDNILYDIERLYTSDYMETLKRELRKVDETLYSKMQNDYEEVMASIHRFAA